MGSNRNLKETTFAFIQSRWLKTSTAEGSPVALSPVYSSTCFCASCSMTSYCSIIWSDMGSGLLCCSFRVASAISVTCSQEMSPSPSERMALRMPRPSGKKSTTRRATWSMALNIPSSSDGGLGADCSGGGCTGIYLSGYLLFSHFSR